MLKMFATVDVGVDFRVFSQAICFTNGASTTIQRQRSFCIGKFPRNCVKVEVSPKKFFGGKVHVVVQFTRWRPKRSMNKMFYLVLVVDDKCSLETWKDVDQRMYTVYFNHELKFVQSTRRVDLKPIKISATCENGQNILYVLSAGFQCR